MLLDALWSYANSPPRAISQIYSIIDFEILSDELK